MSEFVRFGEAKVIITRVLDAPRELVWQAWTDPAMLAQWWGPKGFTNPVCDMDVRVGGRFYIVMRAPGGAEYPMTGMFYELVPPRRLVFTTSALDDDGNRLLAGTTTVTLVQRASKTKLTVTSNAIGLAPIAPQMLAGMEAGWTQSIDRLDQLWRKLPDVCRARRRA